MATQSDFFDITTQQLDIPKTLCYGLVRGSGNLAVLHEMADKTRVAAFLLGEGPWDSIVNLWINRKKITLPDTTKVHFHPGLDGEIGFGMGTSSTGGDQHVDAFWASVPNMSVVTYSRYAYVMVKVPPDPAAPSADLELLADYHAMKCRIFDNTGAQTSFAWSQNPAWWICDFLIRKFILREAKVNQPLVTLEKNRFDWQSFVDSAGYYDVDIGGGIKRFSDGGVVWLDQGLTADRGLEQFLLLCRSYLRVRNGKFTLYADQPRSSVFTFTIDNIAPGSFEGKKTTLRQGKNRVAANWREVGRAAGSTDDATSFAIASNTFDHNAHQRAIGARGPGLAVIPKAQPALQLDYANNTAERVARLVQYQLVRQLGDDVDPEAVYNAPFRAEWTGFEDSLAVEPGDVVTIGSSISEEFGGKTFEVLEVEDKPDGARAYVALEYEANAFTDVAPTQQEGEAPAPGTGTGGGDGTGGTPVVSEPSPFAYDSGGPSNNAMWVRWRWKTTSGSDYNLTLPDGANILVPGSAGLAVPPSPTLSEVGSGTDIARTIYVRIAYVKEKLMYAIGAEASFARSANKQLKVTSPAAVAGYDGWVPLAQIATNFERIVDGANPHLGEAIPFGTDWTEQSDGVSVHASGTSWTDDSVQKAARVWKLPVSVTRYFYPNLDIVNNIVEFAGGALSATDPLQGIRSSREGHRPLSTAAMSAAVPAGGGSGGGSSGGGGDGACFAPTAWILTEKGPRPIQSIVAGDMIFTRSGLRVVKRLIEHRIAGRMMQMTSAEDGRADPGGLVTPGHHFAVGCEWLPASELFPEFGDYAGPVFNLEIDAEEDAREYQLANGWFAHNTLK